MEGRSRSPPGYRAQYGSSQSKAAPANGSPGSLSRQPSYEIGGREMGGREMGGREEYWAKDPNTLLPRPRANYYPEGGQHWQGGSMDFNPGQNQSNGPSSQNSQNNLLQQNMQGMMNSMQGMRQPPMPLPEHGLMHTNNMRPSMPGNMQGDSPRHGLMALNQQGGSFGAGQSGQGGMGQGCMGQGAMGQGMAQGCMGGMGPGGMGQGCMGQGGMGQGCMGHGGMGGMGLGSMQGGMGPGGMPGAFGGGYGGKGERPREACRNWAAGRCTHGATCRYSHEGPGAVLGGAMNSGVPGMLGQRGLPATAGMGQSMAQQVFSQLGLGNSSPSRGPGIPGMLGKSAPYIPQAAGGQGQWPPPPPPEPGQQWPPPPPPPQQQQQQQQSMAESIRAAAAAAAAAMAAAAAEKEAAAGGNSPTSGGPAAADSAAEFGVRLDTLRREHPGVDAPPEVWGWTLLEVEAYFASGGAVRPKGSEKQAKALTKRENETAEFEVEEALKLQKQLHDGFSDALFQEGLKRLQHRFPERKKKGHADMAGFFEAFEALALSIYTNVLPDWGLTPDWDGVRDMVAKMRSALMHPKVQKCQEEINVLMGLPRNANFAPQAKGEELFAYRPNRDGAVPGFPRPLLTDDDGDEGHEFFVEDPETGELRQQGPSALEEEHWYQVLSRPVVIREQADEKSKMVGRRKTGKRLRVQRVVSGRWLQLHPSELEKLGVQEAWVQLVGEPEGGGPAQPMLERVR